MNIQERKWLEEVIPNYDFYLINDKLYMRLHKHEGIGWVFRPYEKVVGRIFFDTTSGKDDLNEIEFDYIKEELHIVKLPKNISTIKNHVFTTYYNRKEF